MEKILTTSFTLKLNIIPDLDNVYQFFEKAKFINKKIDESFMDVEFEKHPDYNDVWVFSVSYPLDKIDIYSKRIKEFIKIIQ